MAQTLSAKLSTGTITVEVDRAVIDPAALFGFAERCNPKRSFLFVSKVLGRHVPVRPAVMRRTFEGLAAQIPQDLPGPVLVTGMAETAIGLGAGVHDEYSKLRGKDDVAYLCTTRHALGTPLLAEFQEEHSHASHHLLHRPLDPAVDHVVMNARTLIMVDDEASTGKTFANLYRALATAGINKVERVILVTLTDWSDGKAAAAIGPDTVSISLLSGRYSWEPEAGATVPPVPTPMAFLPTLHSPAVDRDWGRLGIIQPNLPVLPIEVFMGGGERVLVVGTSEHVWQPYLMAEMLEHRLGLDVHFCSVTRSPIADGYTISRGVTFADNYGIGVANYLYNHDTTNFDRIFLCIETPPDSVDPVLLDALGRDKVTIISGFKQQAIWKYAS